MANKQIKYSIRPAAESDYQYCYELTKENMYDLFCRHWGGWVDSAFREGFDVSSTTVVLHDSSRVGYFSLKQDGEGLYLSNLQLSPSIQGRGLGTALLKRIFTKNRLKQISLTTFTDNSAINLYKKLNFVIVNCEGSTVYMCKYPPHAR